MAEEKLTSLLNSLRQPQQQDAERKLVEHVWASAYEHARRRIGESLQGKIGPTEIVNGALNSAFKAVAKSEKPIPNREWFEAIVHKNINFRIADRADYYDADGRDESGKTRVPPEDLADQRRNVTPDQEVTVKEYAVRLAEVLLDEPSEERRLAVVLGELAGYKPGEIEQVLADFIAKREKAKDKKEKKDLENEQDEQDEHAHSSSAIRVWLKKARQRVEDTLGTNLD